MLSPDSTAFSRQHDDERVRHYSAARFDRGARLLAFCCAALYAVLSGGFIFAIVKATLRF
jgi:hypothetical protein